METKIIAVLAVIHKAGLDTQGKKSLEDQIGTWTEFLDAEFGTLDYPNYLVFVKELGYRVFRNSEGRHRLVYEAVS